MPKQLSELATLMLAGCAVVITGLVLRRELSPPAARDTPQVREVEGWHEVASSGSVMGTDEALVRIVEFSDFQCPYCAQVQPELRQLRARHSGRVAIVYRHFPLVAIHPYARGAALAAECAGAQRKFEAYHDVLYGQQDSIGIKSWEDFAAAVQVPDLAEFRACVQEERFRDRVEDDVAAGRAVGVTGTPTFIVNGQMVSGAASLSEVSRWVQLALDGQ